MARTFKAAGSLQVAFGLGNTETGDYDGSSAFAESWTAVFDCIEDLPGVIGLDGFIHAAEVVAATGEWHLADADPFQGMSDAELNSHVFDPVGKAIKAIVIFNTDLVNKVTVARKAANGLPIFLAAGDGVVIRPGGCHVFCDPTGNETGALVAGSNDILAITVAAGAPILKVMVAYGPISP